ncbi:Asp/Glu/hydantoin racemase [soil metagenome]
MSFTSDGAATSVARRPRVGFIVPPAEAVVPPEAIEMYGDDVDFIAFGLALERLTPEGYDAVQHKLVRAASSLKADGVDAIALMGTSLSFYKGAAYNEMLTKLLNEVSGLPSVTMSTAVVDALTATGCRKVAVATAYGEAVNERLRSFLGESGFEVTALEALQIEDVSKVQAVTDEQLIDLAMRTLDSGPKADGLLISCGGLRTLGVTMTLQQRLGMPIVSSSTAGPWAAVRLVGHGGLADGAPARA